MIHNKVFLLALTVLMSTHKVASMSKSYQAAPAPQAYVMCDEKGNVTFVDTFDAATFATFELYLVQAAQHMCTQERAAVGQVFMEDSHSAAKMEIVAALMALSQGEESLAEYRASDTSD